MLCTCKTRGRGFIASGLVKFGVWLCLNAHPRKLKREKLQNPTSTKIATLENFPLYGSPSLVPRLSPRANEKLGGAWERGYGSPASLGYLQNTYRCTLSWLICMVYTLIILVETNLHVSCPESGVVVVGST